RGRAAAGGGCRRLRGATGARRGDHAQRQQDGGPTHLEPPTGPPACARGTDRLMVRQGWAGRKGSCRAVYSLPIAMDTTPAPAPAERLSPDFWRFWTGQTISQLGSSFTLFATPLLIF